MAPTKRPAHIEFDEDTDSGRDESERASDASSQTAARKRRRLTHDASGHEDTESEDDRRHAPFDFENEDEWEGLATQAVREKYALSKSNTPAECGILEQVVVENFMCHDICIFDVGPLINFICGKNGSGKSAILTAITLCLGGKASSTNRGSKLASFIKEGKENGHILVKIKNQGYGAYQPDAYGDTIQVERHFNRNGGSGFKIKSKTGRLISTKKAELEEICDHFSLQIDNPMNVLTQDEARSFISTSSPAEKYKNFVRGVQLEQLDQDYRIIEDNLDQIEAKLDAKRPDVDVLKAARDRAKQRMEQSKRHDGTLDKLRDYRRQLAWAQVMAQEKIRDEYVKEIDIASQKIAAVEEEVEELNNLFQEANTKSTDATAAYEAAEDEARGVLAEKAEEKIKHDEIKKEMLDAQAEQRTIRGALKDAESTINAKRREIEAEEERLAELDGGGAAARLATLEEARESVKEARQNQQNHQEAKRDLEQDEQRALREAREKEQIMKAKQDELRRDEESVEAFARDRSKQDNGFPPQLPTLLRAIQQEQRFAQKPVGPVGKHVRLLKPEWSSILEKSFGSTLSSFIVTSKSDMNILDGIMKRTRCICPIMIGNNQPLDTRPHEPDTRFDTPLRVLDIENDLVRKQLVIQHGIEQTILIADLAEASDVLYGGNRLRNVKMCFAIDPNNMRRGYKLAYSRKGEASQDPIREYSGHSRMKTDIEAQLRIRREALQETKNQLRELEADFRTARDAHQKTKQALVRHTRVEQELRVAFQQAEDRVEELISAIAEDSTEGARLDVLRQALNEAENAKTLHEGSYQDSVIALDVKKAQLSAARAGLAVFDERITESQETSRRLSVEAQKLSKRRSQALGDKNAAFSRIDDAKLDRGSLERKRDQMNMMIAEFEAQASNISSRVNVDEGETEATIKAKYERLTADYQKFQQRLGATREEIAAEAAKTSEAFNKAEKDFVELQLLGEKMKKSLVERRERWKLFRSFISCRAKANFTYLLSERSFRGRLITDHREQLLELSVEPDITKRSGDGRGAKTLSGGEKSFSQICLLLSIWEAMGSPIRCLDEFDVYMDAVNRNMSVNLLIEAARHSVGRQFILISPGTRSDIRSAADVHTIELAPPERGQARINFAGHVAAAA